jgi:hypothetical protein
MKGDKTEVKVTVHYIAAAKPLKIDADSSMTLAAVKAEALSAFTLEETDTKVYKMFAHKSELADLAQTVGVTAQGKPVLQIDLEEFIIQGA